MKGATKKTAAAVIAHHIHPLVLPDVMDGVPLASIPWRQRTFLLTGQKRAADNGLWDVRRHRGRWVLRRPRPVREEEAHP